MTTTPSSLLKIHCEELPEATRPELAGVAGFDRLCAAFETATGWGMACVLEAAATKERRATVRSRSAIELELPGTAGLQRLIVSAKKGRPSPLSQDEVQPLAGAVAEMLGELNRTREALWQREAELAAGVPLVPHAEEGARLAARLEATLKSGAEAIDCQAAGLYLLDEATSTLKLRAAWRLSPERFLEGPRPLRGAVADLEALSGHAVAIEESQYLPHWRIPELDFPAAVCVPVSTPTTPLGTLWGFSTSPRPFSDKETGLWEVVAGRIAADLEREMLLNEAVEARSQERALASLSQWQQDRRPQTAPLVDEYEFSAWSPPGPRVAGSFHDWQVLRDGAVTLAAGCAHAPGLAAALGSAQLLALLRAHVSHNYEAGELMARVNESLWHASPGDERSSLAYARLDPARNGLELAAAGTAFMGIVKPGAVDLLAGEPTPLAVEAELTVPLISRQLAPGEALVLCAVAADPKGCAKGKAWNAKRVLQAVVSERVGRAEQLVTAIRRKLDELDAAATADAAIVAVKRRA